MTDETIFVAVRNYDGRRKRTIYAWDAQTAKTLIRNHVDVVDPQGGEWVEGDRGTVTVWVLTGTDTDVECEVREVPLEGYPHDHTDDT